MRNLKNMTILGGVILVVGCATVTTGSNDVVTIDTDPSGAVCKLTRGDKLIGAINPTPGSIEVPKSQHDLTVRCDREGYLTSEGTIGSDFQAMTLGNVILGGLIGIAVDAASGAMTKYEDGVTITLIPEAFPSETERDAFFDGLIANLESNYTTVVNEINRGCADESECERKVKKAMEKRDTRLAELEAQRQQVKITGQTTPEDGYTPLPEGIIPPYEGEKLSKYSAEDMKWFCDQDWETRQSPLGRTELNPCHRPDAFTK